MSWRWRRNRVASVNPCSSNEPSCSFRANFRLAGISFASAIGTTSDMKFARPRAPGVSSEPTSQSSTGSKPMSCPGPKYQRASARASSVGGLSVKSTDSPRRRHRPGAIRTDGQNRHSRVHDIDGASFRQQPIERTDVMKPAVRYVDRAWNIAARIEQCVHLHGRVRGTKMSPGKYRQAKIDGCRIQGANGVLQLFAQTFIRVQPPCLTDQALRELRIDAPVAGFVGVGQGRTVNPLAKAHVVELRRL